MKYTLATLGLLASSVLSIPLEEQSKKPSHLVESSKLRSKIHKSHLLKKGKELESIAYLTPGRNRLISTAGHQGTIDWLEDSLPKHYYDVTIQPFEVPDPFSSDLSVAATSYRSWALDYSPEGEVVGPIVPVANLGCNASDFSDLTGSIALISRGSCTFFIKETFAVAAGAAAVLIYNNVDGPLDSATLNEPGDYVPTIGITKADGLAFLASLPQVAEVTVAYTNITTYNVIAQTKGGDPLNVIHAGAHSDSVEAGPGINDNGSGTIALLEIAQQLADFDVKNAVRFSWWSAEEEGLLGSEAYVASLSPAEVEKIRLYLNFDMIASPNFVYAIYDGDGSAFNISGPPGSAQAEKLFQDYYTKIAKLPWTSSPFNGRSDYDAFLKRGIPAGGLDTGAEGIKTAAEAAIFGGQAGVAYDINYHGPGDNFTNLAQVALLENTKAIAHAIATYGSSFSSLPPKAAKKRFAPKLPVSSRSNSKKFKKVTS